MPSKDEALLKKIREEFTRYQDAWREIRQEGKKDMKYISGDPWDEKERAEREDPAVNRPCLTMDELSQYINQLNNSVRQNPRAIKVLPLGEGANDKTAQFRQDMIRGIEYKSNAQSAYTCAFENAAQRSYGFFRISKVYVQGKSFNQELKVTRIPNPDVVYFDPDCKEIDGSDAQGCFVVDNILKEKYLQDWPHAEVRDFTAEAKSQAPEWSSDTHVQVAEYWEVKTEKRTLLEINGPAGKTNYFLDEIEGGTIEKGAKGEPSYLVIPGTGRFEITNQRDADKKTVVQYFTNGLEILDTVEWEGQWIPIVPVLGKEIYLDKGTGSKRVLMSLIRLGRDPYMLYCYYRTCQAELVSMTPKTPYIGYAGQFDIDKENWKHVNKLPTAYLQVNPVLDATGQNVLPLPQRQSYEPQIQTLEIGAEAAKRAIQSAIGMFNTSVGRADTKATSGVAVKALDQQSDQGTFHFIDNYDMALKHGGRIINEMIDFVYDTARQVGMVGEDGKYFVGETTIDPQTGAVIEHNGEHDVTISTGPSYQSQRDEVNEFLQSLANTPQGALVMDLLVKSRNLGPYGDKIAERLVPPQFAAKDENGQDIPPAIAQKLQQANQQIQDAHQVIQIGQQHIQQLQQEKANRVLENQTAIAKANIDKDTTLAKAKIDAATRIRVAELQSKSRSTDLIAQAQADKELTMLEGGIDQPHEAALQAQEQAHEREMQAADQEHEAEQNTQAQDATANQAAQAQAAQAEQAASQPQAGA